MIGLLLAAPFALALPAVGLLSGHLGATAVLGLNFGAFALFWLAALLVAATGRARLFGAAGLVLAGAWLSIAVFFAGGASSPLMLLALALPFEAWWVFRNRKAAQVGAAVAVAVAVAQFPLGIQLGGGFAAAAWQWLVPALWGGLVALRLRPAECRPAVAELAADTISEQNLDAMVLRLSPVGEVVSASRRTEAVLGVEPGLLAGSILLDRVHIADRIAYLSALADLREGAERRDLELRLRLPVTHDDAGAHAFAPFALDLSREEASGGLVVLLRRNDALADLRAALVEAQDAAAAGDAAKTYFLATVSHELRTPLNAIIGFSDMLLHDMFGDFADPRQKDYVRLVHDSGQHLLAVVNTILDVAKIEAGCYVANPEPFRFGEAVEMCQSMMQLQAKAKEIEVATAISGAAGDINADRRAVQQILINLLSNAIKFTPEGGKVDIGAKRVGSRLHFWVKDNGIGISEADQARLCKPFAQVQNDYTRRFEGTGLGLSLVKGLVAIHDGTMAIQSAPGEGTTVTISLPVEGPKNRPETGKDAPSALPLRKVQEERHGSLRKAG